MAPLGERESGQRCLGGLGAVLGGRINRFSLFVLQLAILPCLPCCTFAIGIFACFAIVQSNFGRSWGHCQPSWDQFALHGRRFGTFFCLFLFNFRFWIFIFRFGDALGAIFNTFRFVGVILEPFAFVCCSIFVSGFSFLYFSMFVFQARSQYNIVWHNVTI